jgi:hypothetical protein
MGSSKVWECINPSRDCFGPYNGRLLNAYLVQFSEVSEKDFVEFDGQLKGLVTDGSATINQKFLNQVVVNSYHKFLIYTNKPVCVKISDSNRRYVYIRASDELISNTPEHRAYFTRLAAIPDNKSAMRTIYDWLMNLDLSTFNSKTIIKTPYGDMVQDASRNPVSEFLHEKAFDLGTSPDPRDHIQTLFATELFKMYEEWRTAHGIAYTKKCSALIPDITHELGNDPNRIRKILARHRKGTRYMVYWKNINDMITNALPSSRKTMEEFVGYEVATKRSRSDLDDEADSEYDEEEDEGF